MKWLAYLLAAIRGTVGDGLALLNDVVCLRHFDFSFLVRLQKGTCFCHPHSSQWATPILCSHHRRGVIIDT